MCLWRPIWATVWATKIPGQRLWEDTLWVEEKEALQLASTVQEYGHMWIQTGIVPSWKSDLNHLIDSRIGPSWKVREEYRHLSQELEEICGSKTFLQTQESVMDQWQLQQGGGRYLQSTSSQCQSVSLGQSSIWGPRWSIE